MIAERVETNLFEFYEYAAAAAGFARCRRDGFSYVSFRPSHWAHTVYDLDLPSEGGLPAAFTEGISAGSIPNKIRLGPRSRPQDLERRLVLAGFSPVAETRGMTLELGRRAGTRVPRDLTLGLMDAEEDFLAAARLVVSNLFKSRMETAHEFARVLGVLGRDRAFGLLGRVDGEPISTAFAFIDGAGVGGLYFVATEERLRGRGYGAATVGAALDELERRAVEGCILHATEAGRPVYERLGFVDACRLVNYALPS